MVCLTCKKIYRPDRNGVFIQEMMPIGDKNVVWKPYKIWVGDLLKCPGCGHQVVAGIPLTPYVEHYHSAYERELERIKNAGKFICDVEDCGPLQLGNRPGSFHNEETQQMKSALHDARMQLSTLKATIEELESIIGEEED